MRTGRHTSRHIRLGLVALAGGVIACWTGYMHFSVPSGPKKNVAVQSGATAQTPAISEEFLHKTCSRCHRVPPPDAFPRSAWRSAVSHMLTTAGATVPESIGIPVDAVAKWYEERAPEQLPQAESPIGAGRNSPALRHHEFWLRGLANVLGRPSRAGSQAEVDEPSRPGVSNVQFLDLVDDARLELVVCDMWNGLVLVGKPYEQTGELEIVGRALFPAHAELVDLDRDGLSDLVVAELGSHMPQDHRNGAVVWFRSRGERGFEAFTLEGGLGRVADVRAADFDGDGDQDLIVAEFGYRASGRIFLMENVSDTPDQPRFEPHVVDPRHGAIHVPVIDLDRDGRLDFVALISQEHEAVVAFLNRGALRFEPCELDRAPHPAWGSSGLELVDLDGDGDQDMLITNGDSSDLLPKLRPYHGIRWLENVGARDGETHAPGVISQFISHSIGPMYGVHRAEAGDLDGDGDRDIVACSFIPLLHTTAEHHEGTIESIVWLEQLEPRRFVRHSFEVGRCDHATLSLGDYDLDGDVDIAVGNYIFEQGVRPEKRPWVELWENLKN